MSRKTLSFEVRGFWMMLGSVHLAGIGFGMAIGTAIIIAARGFTPELIAALVLSGVVVSIQLIAAWIHWRTAERATAEGRVE